MVECTCLHCETVFQGFRRGMKYCSLVCCDRYWAKKNRVQKAERSRLYGQKKYGWKPLPTEQIACVMCGMDFLPKSNWTQCCSRQCSARLRYKKNPEKHRAKVKRLRLKNIDVWKARGRMTWAKMRAEAGSPTARHMKARYPWLSILNGCISRSKKNGRPCDIDREWCVERWTGRCELTGIEFVLNTPKRDNCAPSIDQIEPGKGYTKDNCRFILWMLNAFKFTGTDADMYRVAEALLRHRPNISESPVGVCNSARTGVI